MIPFRLDTTSASDVARVADQRRDVTLLVSNAGTSVLPANAVDSSWPRETSADGLPARLTTS